VAAVAAAAQRQLVFGLNANDVNVQNVAKIAVVAAVILIILNI